MSLPPSPPPLLAARTEAALVEIARSGFDMKGTPFSRARLSLDVVGLRKAMAAPPRAGEDRMAQALRLLREGKVRFHVWQDWEIAVSGARRKEFNLLVVKGVWPKGVPAAMNADLTRYLAYVERDVDMGQHWQFDGGGGRPLRGRYNDEPWIELGRGPMTALIVGLYLEGPASVPGTRGEFREGLQFLLNPPPAPR